MNRRSFLAHSGILLLAMGSGCLGRHSGEDTCDTSDTDLPLSPACADGIGSFWGYLLANAPVNEPVTAADDDRIQSVTIIQQILERATTTPEDALGGVVTEDDVVYRVVTIEAEETTAEERKSAAESLHALPAGEHPDFRDGWYLDHPAQPLFLRYGARNLPD